jgi:hypothetical protein
MFKNIWYIREILIFVFSFAIFYFSWVFFYSLNINQLPLQSEDIIPSVFTGVSIVENQTLYLNQYYEMMVSKYPQPDDSSLTPFYLTKVGENYLSAFPILSSVLSFPVFYIYLLFVGEIGWNDIYQLSHLSGSFILSLCVLFLYIFLNKVLKISDKLTYLILAVYGLATINLSLVSQGLWQHGVVQLFSILGLIYFYQKNYFLTFMFLGFGVLARPTALIVVIIFGLFLIVRKELKFKNLIYSLAGFLIPVGFFLGYNQIYYRDISNQGYSGQIFDSWLGNFPESFFGVWLSPSKGILIYSPVLLFSLISIYKGFRKQEIIQISFWIILIHTLVLSKWKHWYGGFGYGYRMISDIIPFLVLPLVYLLHYYYEKIKLGFLVTLAISIIIQVSGLVFFDSIWHSAYDKGFRNTSWLWSLENSEAAFNIRRIMVKGGLLDRACEKCEPQNTNQF